MSYTIANITPRIAARLNDAAQEEYTDAVLLPYAQDAGDALQLRLELHGILVLEKAIAPIVIPIGRTNLGATTSLIPADMLEPQRLEERLSGSTDMYEPMIRRMWTPDILPSDSLRYWDYREENIFFVGATTARDIKIYYLKRLIDITSTASVIAVNNSQLYMITKTAALAARFIGENPSRADELDKEAENILTEVVRVGTKSKQGTRTRRRPFVVMGKRRWI